MKGFTTAWSRFAVLAGASILLAGGMATGLPAAAAEVVICDGLPATIVGTDGDDTLTGTEGTDVIAGLGGNDTISGLGGDDVICAGGGDDTVYGNDVTPAGVVTTDNDRIFGEGGRDTLLGEFGTFTGPAAAGLAGGADYIVGGPGNDTIAGSGLTATITSTAVNLTFTSDTLVGGNGADTIYGQVQTLTFVLTGNVTLAGGDSMISGGEGGDTIYGDFETFTTGSGVAVANGFKDTIAGGPGGDTLYGDFKTLNGTVIPVGDAMNDTIDGGEGSDTADGGPGTDTCTSTETATNCEL